MRLLRFPDLKIEKGVPYSRAHLDRLEKAGGFPQRIRLSSRTVAWVEAEIDSHVAAKMAERENCTITAASPYAAAGQSDPSESAGWPVNPWERAQGDEPR